MKILNETNFSNKNFTNLMNKIGIVKDNNNRKNLPEFTVNDIRKSTDFNHHKKMRYQKSIYFF